LLRAVVFGGHLQDLGVATDDRGDRRLVVEIQPVNGPEAVTQRRRQHRVAGGRPYEGKVRDREANGARARPPAEHDVERVVLHRRVKHLFRGARQAVNLVDEQHVVLLKVRQDRGEVARALNGWAGGDAHGDAHLRSDDVGERGLAKAGRAIEEQVVERFVALLGGVYGDAEIVLELLLADEFIEPPWSQRDVDLLVVFPRLAGDNALLSGRSPALPRMLVLLRTIIGSR